MPQIVFCILLLCLLTGNKDYDKIAAIEKAISEKMNAGALMAFEEDRSILEHIHAGMKIKRTPNIDLGLDAGAKQFRLMLKKRIDSEKTSEI